MCGLSKLWICCKVGAGTGDPVSARALKWRKLAEHRVTVIKSSTAGDGPMWLWRNECQLSEVPIRVAAVSNLHYWCAPGQAHWAGTDDR